MTADPDNQAVADDAKLMKAILSAWHGYEAEQGYPRSDVRERVTGVLTDKLFSGCRFTKRLASGLEFSFRHTGRISREFLLAKENPDHVWEPQTTLVLEHFGRKARQALIGGAYFGDHALPLAQAMRASSGVVHAFEPTAEQYEFLCANARRNNLDNLVAHCQALWSRPNVRVRLEGDDELASPVEAAADDPDAVSATSIDAYLDQNDIDHLDLIMLDVEGGEHAALLGAKAQLGRTPLIIFETNSRYADWSRGLARAESCELLRQAGYDLFAIRDYHANTDMSTRPVELIPAEDTLIDGPPHGFNMLAVARPDLIEDSLFRIVHQVSPKLLPQKCDPRFDPVPLS